MLVTFSVCNVMTINLGWRTLKLNVDAKGLANRNDSVSSSCSYPIIFAVISVEGTEKHPHRASPSKIL